MTLRLTFALVTLALAAAPPAPGPVLRTGTPGAGAPVTAGPLSANDSLLRAVAAPVPSAFAPTACVVPEDQDPRAVRRLLDEQVTAWNHGDLEGFMRGYWKSDSLTFYSGGNVSHGWQVTHDRYRKRYQSEGREMGVLAFDVHDVTLVGRGDALVRGGWSLKMKDGEPHGLFTLWLRWFPEAGWRVVHDHSSAAQ